MKKHGSGKRYLSAAFVTMAATMLLAAGNITMAQETDSALAFDVKQDVDISDSKVFDRAKDRGYITIGIKEDQPGFGERDAVTGERSGFDVNVARWVAAELGFGDDNIKYKLVPTPNREQSLQNGDTDIIVGMYTISDNRKELVDFAGPYLSDAYGILVRSDYDEINSEDDMDGHTVCSITGSTPVQYIRKEHPKVDIVEFDNTAQCIQALQGGQVDAVSTDQSLLIGYATKLGDEVKVTDARFVTSGFGIGIAKGNDSLRHYINDVLTNGTDTLSAIWDAELGDSGIKYKQVDVDDYE